MNMILLLLIEEKLSKLEIDTDKKVSKLRNNVDTLGECNLIDEKSKTLSAS